MTARTSAKWLLGASLLALGCPTADRSDESGALRETRACGLDVWYRASSREAHVELVGSWDGFTRPGRQLSAERDDGWRTLHVDAPTGDVRYAIVDDGTWQPDPLVATTAWEGEREVSWAHVADCRTPLLRVDGVDPDPERGGAVVRASFVAAAAETHRLVPSSLAIRTRTGEVVAPAAVEIDAEHGTMRIELADLERGKHVFTLSARDESGRETEPARASVWIGATPARDDVATYQIVIDRFAGDAGPLATPSEPAARAGGTLRGVRAAIERGDFEAMGITTLWLSPVYRNPSGFFSGGIGRRFSAYHGYWPTDSRAVEPALGSDEDLQALVAAAHARGLRVILDVVPNHVHEQHPYWRDRQPGSQDFNAPDGKCLCGTETCPWATSIERCWFAPYLPDLDTRREDVLGRVSGDVLYWLDRFELDGLRIDAVPMMPRSTTRRIAALARARFEHPGHPLYLVGETFTSEQGYDALRYNLGRNAGGLDGQFHFPLMWAIRKSIAIESQPVSSIDDAVRAGEDAFRGAGAVMATIIGNHDVTRFASESDGTAGGDGFIPAPTPTSETVFAKQRLALGLLFALPGAPVVYYGDEVALPGRLDPDSRRVMPREADLSDAAKTVRAFVQRAGKLRRCSAVLRGGRYLPIAADAESLSFARSLDAESGTADPSSALIVLSRRPAKPEVESTLHVDPTMFPPGRYLDALDPGSPPLVIGRDGLTSLALPPFSLRIFLREGDPCAAPR